MIIAVNTRLRKEEQPAGYEEFLFYILNSLTNNYPAHRFLLITDKDLPSTWTFGNNTTVLVAGPQTSSTLRLRYWLNYRIPALLRKHKADVLVSFDGTCSLRTKKPQCMLISDLRFLEAPQLIKRSVWRFYKKYTPAFLAKANSLASISEFSRTALTEKYKPGTIITLVEPGINPVFTPMEWEHKELIRERYAEGKAYFLFSGDINQNSNTINLLKAFSFFKKRQKSSMLLLLAGKADDNFKKELKTYKFRNEVKMLEDLTVTDLAKITAAAYALVHPVLYADLATAALQAMQCGTPVVASATGALPAFCGDAALYVDPLNYKDVAENMMLVFKDENRAAELVEAGYLRVQQLNWDKSAGLMMECILRGMGGG